MRLSCLFIFLAIFYCSDSYSQIKNENDLKKQAEKNFEDEDYNLAYKLYAQLVSLYPKDPDYNYKLGVCMLYTEPDKKKPYSYLQIAIKNPANAPKDAKFYLAKTYHINYRFDEAIKLYTEYKEIGSAASIKKLQVDREIQACKNGKRLLSNLSDLIVVSKKQLNEADYYKGYDVKEIGGKLLVKPDEYKTAYDKKKKDKSVVYLPRSGERLYYSSYGENGNNGRDIYFVNKLPNGSWSKAQILPSSINTEFDEDYPFLHPNGKTLYFSSKGHNSMGGYDVFKTTFNDETKTWSKPENLEFPINSPDDDILFITDSLEKTAFFSTGRYSPYGKIDVLKINTERRPMNFAVMKGTVVKEEASQSVKSKITVKNMANGEIVGTYQAQDNGDYNMELPNGGKFIFTVETPGIPTQSDGVQIPTAYALKPYKQVISYDKKVLKIINYFEGAEADENYAMMIDLIEKKAKLEVNENEPYNNNLKDVTKNKNAGDENKNLNSVSTTNPTVGVKETNTTANTNKNVTNDQLLTIAKTDAKEASDEAAKLKQEAQDAFGLATQKTAEAVEKQKEANQAFENANTITSVAKKNEELSKANQLKEEAKIASSVANTATNMAKKLEVDASIQQKEADLTNQYISQLEAITKNKNNKEALTKLEGIQKELDDLSKQKNQSDELFTSLKAEAELKQQELNNSEKKSNSIVSEINSIKNESENLEKDLSNESDKSLKENISAQIRELKNEIDLKNKELATNNQKNEVLKNEVDGVNQELQIAAKILNEKTEEIATNNSSNENNNAVNSSTNSLQTTNVNSVSNENTNNTPALSYQGITSKYSGKINSTASNKSNKDELEKQNNILKTYNNEVTDLIAIDKNQLTKTNDATSKKKINEEIINLEKLKTENDNAIVTNSTTINQLESNPVVNNAVNENSNIENINVNENNNATTNNTNVNNTNSIIKLSVNNPETLINEAETLNNKAYEQRKVAATKTGSEKETLLKQATENEKLATNKKLEASVIYQNQNKENFENNTSNLTELQKLTGAKTSNEISQANTLINDAGTNFKQAQKIRTEAENNPSDAAKLGGLSNAEEKENEALTKQQKALEILSKVNPNYNVKPIVAETNTVNPVVNTNSEIINNPEVLVNEAEKLNDKAYEQRKEAVTKTGSEKEELIKQATENEKLATDKKLEASVLFQHQNRENFKNNTDNLTELQKLTGTKTGNEISQANMLVDEAVINFKQAQKIRTEAEAYPSGAAKLGGLSNAEEKENEALAKQQKAVEILSKENPNYKLKLLDSSIASSNSIATNNNEATLKSNEQITTYLTSSKSNQSELNLKNEQLTRNPTYNNSNNKQVKELKATSDNLNNEAKTLIDQSLIAKTTSEKTNLLLKANEKETEAIKVLNQATELMNKNSSAIANNSVSTNTINNNANKTTSTNTVAAINNESSLTNTVAVNNEKVNSNSMANPAITNNSKETPSNNSNSINGKGVGDEASKLKTNLNNSNEATLSNFNTYSNSEAITLKDNAYEKINSALTEDVKLSSALDNVSQLANNNSTGSSLNQQSIISLITEADKLNDDAFALRKLAATKTGAEKETDINNAKTLEANAVSKKIEAANKQKQLNTVSYEANKQSLKELATLAKGKNISELSSVDMQINEANLLLKQADNLRQEADAYPSDGAKLGGYSNAEEKELQALAKQQAILDTYKKHFPNYKPKTANVSTDSHEAVSKLNETKSTINTNTEKHVEGLGLLVQANEKEYKNRFINLPTTLNTNQTGIKTKAQASYKKNQDILVRANTSTDLTTKKNLLIEATKSGQDAISLLNQITTPNAVVTNNTSVNETNTNSVSNTNNNITNNNNNNTSTNNSTNNNNVSKTTTTNTTNSVIVKIKVEDLEVKNNNAYTADKPIPIDEKIQDGLVFKVQIGAFKTALPNNTFKGLSPVIAQTTPSGYIRYMAGNFEKYSSANAVKNDLRNLGYSDAFVVGYYNGKRINLNEATDKAKTAGQTIEPTTNTSAGLTNNANVPKYVAPTNVAVNTNTNDAQPIVITNELEKMNGLLYTIQIGVYSKQVTRSQLFNLKPIYTEQLPNGLYRYTAGIYNQSSRILEDKRKVVNLGVKDAFISSYYNTKRIPFADGQKLQTENSNLKMETENLIVFSGAASPSAPITNSVIAIDMNTLTQPATNNTTASTVTAFSNGITSGPLPTTENGVKTDDTGISYKVQIGAYKNQVPNDIASKFLNIKTWPVKNVVINGLFIYTIGNFNAMTFAKKLKDEAISLGITDAYITIYKDGKKLYGAEATQYLGN